MNMRVVSTWRGRDARDTAGQAVSGTKRGTVGPQDLVDDAPASQAPGATRSCGGLYVSRIFFW
ncbi:hypothetical protein CFR80_00880 [Komagataeibacter oboediens]|uniref:Uncharacterized protein n=1 Tax=Komagataeibacter oboediens TaxID=65958 RepID=A0A318QV79_9PROT|nr:hypothetical protein CFR80_00880 [Komagataeibacter oboediens]